MNHDRLTKTVDLIYEHEALKATLGLTTALNDISKAAKLESDIKALLDLVGLVKNVKEASRELASLLKSNDRIKAGASDLIFLKG